MLPMLLGAVLIGISFNLVLEYRQYVLTGPAFVLLVVGVAIAFALVTFGFWLHSVERAAVARDSLVRQAVVDAKLRAIHEQRRELERLTDLVDHALNQPGRDSPTGDLE